jgi:adenylate kinase family enzyme
MRRIVIIGCSGAGKSTLARQLGELTSLPVIHLDAVIWQPGWVMMERANEVSVLQQLVERPEWIIDGSYMSTASPRLAAADTIIFLDFPRWLCLWRIVKRVIKYYGQVRPDMGEGCPERWDWGFMHWVWTYRRKQRPLLLEKVKQHVKEGQVLIFRKPAEVTQFLKQVSAAVQMGKHKIPVSE